MAEQNQRLAQCFHCGNTGLLSIEKIHRHDYGGPILDEVGDAVDFEPREIFSWFLLSCPVCEKVTLIQDYDFEDMPYTETVTLYPQSRLSLNNVPLYIRQSFEAALKIKNIDIAMCSIALRKTLEAICNDKGAQGSNLEKKIKYLVDSHVFPDGFDDVCWIIRQLGNQAAHENNIPFYKNQIDKLIDFMELILKYLYELPLEVEELKNRLHKAEESKQEAKQ